MAFELSEFDTNLSQIPEIRTHKNLHKNLPIEGRRLISLCFCKISDFGLTLLLLISIKCITVKHIFLSL